MSDQSIHEAEHRNFAGKPRKARAAIPEAAAPRRPVVGAVERDGRVRCTFRARSHDTGRAALILPMANCRTPAPDWYVDSGRFERSVSAGFDSVTATTCGKAAFDRNRGLGVARESLKVRPADIVEIQWMSWRALGGNGNRRRTAGNDVDKSMWRDGNGGLHHSPWAMQGFGNGRLAIIGFGPARRAPEKHRRGTTALDQDLPVCVL